VKPGNDNDLVLLMHFDNRSEAGENKSNSDIDVYDWSGYANHGNVSGPLIYNRTGGKFAGTYKYDLCDGYVIAGNSSVLNITNTLTISLWFNYYGGDSGWAGLVERYDWDEAGYFLGIGRASNALRFYLFKSGATGLYAQDDDSIIWNKWYHVVAVKNATNMSIFLDGVETYSRGWANTIDSHYANLTLGNRECFNGTMDEVAIWNRSLAKEEILDLYRLGENRYYWKVNATDSGGRSNESLTNEFTVGNNPPGIEIHSPQNNSATMNTSQVIEATITDAESNTMTVWIWGSNHSDFNMSNSLLYLNTSVASGTVLNFNWTGRIVQPGEDRLKLLIHSDVSENPLTDHSGMDKGITTTGAPGWNTTAGRFAGATVWDGDDDYMTITPPALMGNGSSTISWWMRTQSDRYMTIFSNDIDEWGGMIELCNSTGGAQCSGAADSIRVEANTNNAWDQDFSTGILL